MDRRFAHPDAGVRLHPGGGYRRPGGLVAAEDVYKRQALYEDGYEGFFSIEPHLSHNDAIPGSGADKFAVAVKAIKDLIAQVEAEHAPAQQ